MAQTTQAKGNRLRQFASDFMEGFTKPSRLGAAVGVASFLVTAAFSVWMFSPNTLIGRMGDFLPRSTIDAEAFATVQALRLGGHWIEKPTIIAFGSSTIAQALGNGPYLLDEIREKTGQEWDFISLTTPQQSPFDQLALLETVLKGHDPDGPPMILLITASGQRLTWTPDRLLNDEFLNRVGLQSTWVREEMAQLGAETEPMTGFYVIDNFDFICLNGTEAMLRALVGLPPQRNIAAYNMGPDQEPGNRANPLLRDRYLEGQANIGYFLEFKRRMILRLAGYDNLHIVLTDEPYAPDVLADLNIREAHRQSDALFAEFAAENGVAYWPFSAEAGLQAEDYHDPLHVYIGAPQERLQRSLGTLAVDYIERTGL